MDRLASRYDNNEDLYTGYDFQPKKENLIESLMKINKGEPLTDDRFHKNDLFSLHPALVISFNKLPPCKRGTRNYYYFYCEVPSNTKYDKYGYENIRDKKQMGVWEATSISEVFVCNISEGKFVGERQEFRYTLVNGNVTDWLMVMYGLPHTEVDNTEHIKTSQLNIVICEVYQVEDSETAKAVRMEADMKRKLVQSVNKGKALASKLEHIDVERQAVFDEYKGCEKEISDKRKAHAKSLINRNNAENEEANALVFDQNAENYARTHSNFYRNTFG